MKRDTRELCELFLRLRTATEAKQFLDDLLTPQEFATLTERWQIVRNLARGASQRDVRKKTGAGIMTVTRGAAALKKGSGGFRLMLDRVAKR